MQEKKEISRRGFMKGAAVTAIGAGIAGSLAACTPDVPDEPARDPKLPESWDDEYDVVVVGYGGAGAATAITACDAGATVLILESMAEPGGNTHISGGGFLCPNDETKSLTYIRGLFDLCLAVYDDEVVKVYNKNLMTTKSWLEGLHPSIKTTRYGGAGFPSVSGSESQDKYQLNPLTGTPYEGLTAPQALFNLMADSAESRGADVWLEAPGKRLITDSMGVVCGVVVGTKNGDRNVKAKKGVVLTCGGYEFNDEMLRNYCKGAPIYASGSIGNTGDGIKLAVAVGADLWHMTGASCGLAIKTPDYPSTMGNAGASTGTSAGTIYVDKEGERFILETGIEAHAGLLVVDYYDQEELMYPRIPCFNICDSKKADVRALGNGGSGYTRVYKYTWSTDNKAELAKGWIYSDTTIAGLANKIGCNAANLQKEIAKWNEMVDKGVDEEFGRAANTLGKIDTPPYYASKLYPSLLNTQGGPRRNAKAEVINPFGEPIPRLYSSGELGSLWGVVYQGAGNNAESIVFGRIAGANVAALDSWDEEPVVEE